MKREREKDIGIVLDEQTVVKLGLDLKIDSKSV